MNPLSWLSVIPTWLWLAAAMGTPLACAYKGLRPQGSPRLGIGISLSIFAMATGHLFAIVGEIPSWQLGELRLVPGLALVCIVLLVAKPLRV